MVRPLQVVTTPEEDGNQGCGVVYKLVHRSSGSTLIPLYTFTGGNDGAGGAYLTFGPNGSLYGTTYYGGGGACPGPGCGTVFNLRPPVTRPTSVLAPWSETVLYRFTTGAWFPGAFAFNAGNIYGTTAYGGNGGCAYQDGCGGVYELSNGVWTYSLLYSFTGTTDGGNPYGGVISDQSGNLYGTATFGGEAPLCFTGCGLVFQLAQSGSGWAENVLYDFLSNGGSGSAPTSGLVFDHQGNLYGTTQAGNGNDGIVYELTPSNGGWTYTLVYNLPELGTCQGYTGPESPLVVDGTGNLYGAAVGGGANCLGYIFKLSPSNGSWTFTDLHDFTDGNDGANPYGSLVLDPSGNLYCSADFGGGTGCGGGGCGVVWEITPN